MAFLLTARMAFVELDSLCSLRAKQINQYINGAHLSQHLAKPYRTNCCVMQRNVSMLRLINCNEWTTRSQETCQRGYATQRKAIVERTEEKKFSELTMGEKVTQTGKDVSYLAVVLVGVGVTGALFYLIGREIFSSQSPSGVYGSALKLCRKNEQVIDALGTPIKGYGETTSRGRRRHVSHLVFNRSGVEHIQMKFYVEGPRQKGTVHLEKKKNDSGKYEYVYLVIELDSAYPTRNIILEDNRYGASNTQQI